MLRQQRSSASSATATATATAALLFGVVIFLSSAHVGCSFMIPAGSAVPAVASSSSSSSSSSNAQSNSLTLRRNSNVVWVDDGNGGAPSSSPSSSSDSEKNSMNQESIETPPSPLPLPSSIETPPSPLPLLDTGDEADADAAEVPASTTMTKATVDPLQPPAPSSITSGSGSGRRMSLMWCDRDKCKDVVRERVVGDHNQIILNGPATGQVAYRWEEPEEEKGGDLSSGSGKSGNHKRRRSGITASILLLVKPDTELFQQAAKIVPEFVKAGIRVLLVPDLAAKLKFTYDVVDDVEHIQLFEPPPKANAMFRRDLYVSDDEDEFVQEYLNKKDVPFPDLICTLGGDGLLIHASMLFQGPIPPLLSIAGGSLGFLTSFELEETVDAVKIALGISNQAKANGATYDKEDLDVFPPHMPSYPYDPLIRYPRYSQQPSQSATFGMDGVICMTIRMRLCCRIVNPEGIVRERYNVLNEVVIDRGTSSYLAALECFCDDVHLTTVQADGIIFATPTGSTAYSMAAGGSVVHPSVPSILVTPICPHVLSFRSMVFPDHVVLRCYVPEDARSAASVAFDGKHRRDLNRGDSVQIQMSSYPVPTINRGDSSSDWLGSLKRSFNFNTRPRQRPLQ